MTSPFLELNSARKVCPRVQSWYRITAELGTTLANLLWILAFVPVPHKTKFFIGEIEISFPECSWEDLTGRALLERSLVRTHSGVSSEPRSDSGTGSGTESSG